MLLCDVVLAGMPLGTARWQVTPERKSFVRLVSEEGERTGTARGTAYKLTFDKVECSPSAAPRRWRCRFWWRDGAEESMRSWSVGEDEELLRTLRGWRDVSPEDPLSESATFSISRVDSVCWPETGAECLFYVWSAEGRQSFARVSGREAVRGLNELVRHAPAPKSSAPEQVELQSVRCERFPGRGKEWSCRFVGRSGSSTDLILSPEKDEEAELIVLLRRHAEEVRVSTGREAEVFSLSEAAVECWSKDGNEPTFCRVIP